MDDATRRLADTAYRLTELELQRQQLEEQRRQTALIAQSTGQHGVAAPESPETRSARGWYPDPSGRHDARYWDGSRWTDRVKDSEPLGKRGLASRMKESVDPLVTVEPDTESGSVTPEPADFEVEVVALERTTYTDYCQVLCRFLPSYVGARPIDPAVRLTVIFEVVGGEECTMNFAVEGGHARTPDDRYVSRPLDSVLTAVPKRVLAD